MVKQSPSQVITVLLAHRNMLASVLVPWAVFLLGHLSSPLPSLASLETSFVEPVRKF